MPETIRPVTSEMLRPTMDDRSPYANRQLLYLIRDNFGSGVNGEPDGLRAYYRMGRGEELSRSEKREINSFVFRSIGQYFGVTDRSSCRMLYIQQQKDAINSVDHLREFLPEYSRELDLKNEIRTPSDSPVDLLELLSIPQDKIDPVLAFQIHRHALYSLIAGRHNSAVFDSRLNTIIQRQYKHLSRHLFKGQIGAGQTYYVYSAHDNETNEVVGFSSPDQTIPSTAHLKIIPIPVREIEGFGLVYTNPRKKNDSTVILKAQAMAHHNGGIIDPDGVKDRGGMEFVPMNMNVDLEELADRVIEEMKSGPYPPEKIKVDNQADQDRGQSSKLRMVRRIIHFNGSPISFEFKFCNLENYINSLLEVGIKDPDSGLYDGMSYELYKPRRVQKVLRDVFPPVIYTQDLEGASVKRNEWIAQDLRARYRAA